MFSISLERIQRESFNQRFSAYAKTADMSGRLSSVLCVVPDQSMMKSRGIANIQRIDLDAGTQNRGI